MRQFEMNESERDCYDRGAQDALKFRADPYRDLYQDVFKAETTEYSLYVGWNDPDGSAVLKVKFKNWGGRFDREIEYADPREAVARAIRFVTEHPAPRPWCGVDY